MNNMKSILWGVVLVLLGVLVGTNSLGITNIDIFFDGWWSLFIIIPCFIGLFSNEDKTGNIIVNKEITGAKYDKTIQATIISCIDEQVGKYKIKYKD